MCELATIGLVASLASTAIGGYAQYQQGKAQQAASRQAAQYNSQVAANEAATQRALAQQELQKGAEERSRVLRAGKAKQGEMAALMGGPGSRWTAERILDSWRKAPARFSRTRPRWIRTRI